MYRLLVFAWLVRDEFPELAWSWPSSTISVTGDIPAFEKTGEDERTEEEALEQIASLLPGKRGEELQGIFQEMTRKATPEARLVNAMDKLEALIQHNEADISTWLPLEYELHSPTGRRRQGTSPTWRRCGSG